ncbi:DUF3465 domain-containing protein [Shewanella youngdeokensis]|uniref:DUF3465 domain-containing protein n=1 Tax=Shewanella youngdeokensis TaxID=2999068 RepID=A0ABZ0JZZ9_9GAMM|nr:DUF3465 domain-containing protein [Shewanella sp. DAU334]
MSPANPVKGILFRIVIMLLVLAAASFAYNRVYTANSVASSASFALINDAVAANDESISQAFAKQQSGLQVQSTGVVSKVLADDNIGSRHQRFIVRLSSGQTVLIAHNIDLAPKIDSLKVGDSVSFYGEYEYNNRGGVVHWTHHDPRGRHIGGWLKHQGTTYQ